MKIIWTSRQPLNHEQINDLVAILNTTPGELEITADAVTWQATADAEADRRENRHQWKEWRQAGYAVIAGVFPPVAIEAMPSPYGWDACPAVLTPVSRQAPELRQGESPIPFVHVRWAVLAARKTFSGEIILPKHALNTR